MSRLSVWVRKRFAAAPNQSVEQILGGYFGDLLKEVLEVAEDVIANVDLLAMDGTTKRNLAGAMIDGILRKEFGKTNIPAWVINLVIEWVHARYELSKPKP